MSGTRYALVTEDTAGTRYVSVFEGDATGVVEFRVEKKNLFTREWQTTVVVRAEIEIARQFEAECCVIFQLNDGAGRDERFGIRRRDGTAKPSAYVARGEV